MHLIFLYNHKFLIENFTAPMRVKLEKVLDHDYQNLNQKILTIYLYSLLRGQLTITILF